MTINRTLAVSIAFYGVHLKVELAARDEVREVAALDFYDDERPQHDLTSTMHSRTKVSTLTLSLLRNVEQAKRLRRIFWVSRTTESCSVAPWRLCWFGKLEKPNLRHHTEAKTCQPLFNMSAGGLETQSSCERASNAISFSRH